MRIAQIAPLIERVPPKKYGGTERVIYALTEELVKRGHDVTLFATGDSITSAKLSSVFPSSLREANFTNLYKKNSWTILNFGLAYQRQHEFDIIHDHNGVISLPTANLSPTPVVMTMHGAFSVVNKHVFKSFRNPNIVSISLAQRQPLPKLNYVGNVYNGLDLRYYPVNTNPGKYLLFVGRITKEKGVHIAIEVAKRLNLELIIAAKLEKIHQRYFNRYIKPRLSSKIRWIGEVDERTRNLLMSRALCFLHPVTWREPFGLTLIEAMACGCPIVAFDRGSIPEVVKHGKTGFIAKDIDEMVYYVSQITKIKRQDCRIHALQEFSVEKMTSGYEEVYRNVIKKKYQTPILRFAKNTLFPKRSLISS